MPGAVSFMLPWQLPIGVRFGSEGPQRATGDQMRLNVEGVMDGGMGGQEALG
jgi:hypothetical protein